MRARPDAPLRDHAHENAPLKPGTFAGYRKVITLIISLTLLQAALASLTLVVALHLRAAGASNLALGLVGSCFATGLFMGALFAPREITRVGHIRAFSLFAASAIIVSLAFTLSVEVAAFAVLQVFVGFCFSGLWAAGDGWITRAAPDHMRGAIVSFYHVVNKLGSISGPFIVLGLKGDADGFLLAAALIAAAILPVAATSNPQPETSHTAPFGPARIFKLAPAAAVAAFTAGAVNTAVGQLYPVYVAGLNHPDPLKLSAQFNGALLAGSMIALWPAGLLSDRIDRRLVMGGLGAVGAIAAFILALLGNVLPLGAFVFVVGLYGAGALSHYALAVAHAADKTETHQMTAMMAGILIIWSMGSIIGPLAGGAVMSLGLGPRGLFIYAGIGMALMTIFVLARSRVSDAVPVEDKGPFVPTQTTSLVLAEMDIRGDDEQFDLFDDTDASVDRS